eukprot:snap_masked-scaffold_1-processed-gene-22.53-mRNA-1 protein AED:1.00 eAED:1.00 QI:0/0/0/0/1/1/2/0/107
MNVVSTPLEAITATKSCICLIIISIFSSAALPFSPATCSDNFQPRYQASFYRCLSDRELLQNSPGKKAVAQLHFLRGWTSLTRTNSVKGLEACDTYKVSRPDIVMKK